MSVSLAPGWFGKLPSTGDFIHHRLTEQVITPWNHWFQQGLIHWHQQDAAVSADFLRAPVWNFVLPITPTRQQVQMGCLLPSCDRGARLAAAGLAELSAQSVASGTVNDLGGLVSGFGGHAAECRDSRSEPGPARSAHPGPGSADGPGPAAVRYYGCNRFRGFALHTELAGRCRTFRPAATHKLLVEQPQ